MRTALLAALLCFPAYAAVPELICQEKFCMIKKETLVDLLDSLQKMGERQAQLERLCGWTKP